jgi:hypothetical protein
MTDFTVCREDWSLHRKGDTDAKRHREKVKEAVRSRISDILTEEDIVLADGHKVLRVPIRSLEEYRFRFNPGKVQHVGQGNGKLGVGDLVAARRFLGKGRGAGEEPGFDYNEAEVSIDEIAALVFEELSLPHLEPRREAGVMTEAADFTDVRKKGIWSNIDRKRTLLTLLRRNALKGNPGFNGIRPEDLRFRTWNVRRAPETGAAVIAMMDTSGSMGPFEKFVGRSFFFWMVRFLKANYQNVETVFLAHHTEARETTEEEFFRRGESGGTRCSSVYRLALDVISQRFLPHDFNVYAFHFSDGDNLTSDNELCVELVQKLLQVTNMVGYGEIEGPYYYTSTLRNAFRVIDHPRFVMVTLRDKTDVYKSLKTFFARRDSYGGSR